jgi:organic hydroperoxide reductase OsmC/OhrA
MTTRMTSDKISTMAHEHSYAIMTTWTGNRGAGTKDYRAYARDHEIFAAGKIAPVAGSSDKNFLGDPARYNPEELLVASLSACHMLWFLHLCAVAGIVVTDYRDAATGRMGEHADGAGEFTAVTLHPEVVITDAGRIAEATELHAKAHQLCFIARSVNFPVEHKPVFKTL